jgi:hypothetical protein
MEKVGIDACITSARPVQSDEKFYSDEEERVRSQICGSKLDDDASPPAAAERSG